MRRSVLSSVLTATLSLFACSEQPTEAPTAAPPITRGPASLVVCTAAGIQDQIDALFPAGGLRTSAQAQFSSIPKAVDKESGTAARDKTIAIVDFLLTTYYAGQLTGGLSTATLDQVLDLIRSFYCFARLASPDLPSTSGGSDVVLVLVSPGDPTTTVVTPSQHAAVTIPEGAVPAPTLIAVSLLPDDPPPLRTSLDQYPLFYHFSGTTATGPVTFNLDVTAGVCLRDNIDVPDANLRLAHNVEPFQFGDVEILPRPTGAVPGLDCTDLGLASSSGWGESRFAWAKRLLLPAELHAASVALETTGVGGTTKKFSEFGVVDIFSNPGSLSPVTPASATEQGGSTVTRTVLITSANGTPIPGVPVTFATGDGTVVTPQPVSTDADGHASVSWTLPDEPGTYTLTADAPAEDNAPLDTDDPPGMNIASTPDVAFDPQSLTFTAFVGDFFSDGFEAAEPAWSTSPLWNRSTLKTEGGGSIFNSAFPDYVSLGSGDLSEGALPAPFSGSFALWYGSTGTGNFIGTQVSEDDLLSGGTSTTSNSGDAQSPTFSIPASAPAAVLRFDTWFEIEGVNPDGFDIMSIWVKEGVTETFVGALNPSSAGVGESDKPFTTQGYDLAPAWQQRAFDLSSFKGKTISLIFRFDTRDPAYNGFRGWVIDNVKVNTDPLPIILLRMAQPASGNVEPPRRAR